VWSAATDPTDVGLVRVIVDVGHQWDRPGSRHRVTRRRDRGADLADGVAPRCVIGRSVAPDERERSSVAASAHGSSVR